MRSWNTRGWLSTLFLLLTLGVAFPLQAKSDPHVVLIGISDYTDSQIKDRKHAQADAVALYDLFTDSKYFNADMDNVKLLLGKKDAIRPSQKATRANILKAVEWLVKETDEDDLVIFAFFGQGCSIGKRGDRTCYFAVDSTVQGRDKDAVASADLRQAFDKLKSQQFTIFLDVNFKGIDTGKEKAPPEATLGKNPYQEFLGDDGTLDHAPLDGRALFLAANGLITAPNLEKNSLFTHAILQGLKGKADKTGYEPDGIVTVPELREYVNDEIPELKRKNNLIETDPRKRTDHFVLVGAQSRYPLSLNPDAAAKTNQQLRTFAKLSTRLSKDLTTEGTRFLSRMPKLKAYRNIRKEYQKFVEGKINADELVTNRKNILATMRLAPSVATNFAAVIVKAIDRLNEDYFKEISRAELVSAAITGVYERLDEPVPADVQKKLDKTKNMTNNQLMLLLRDVRLELGKREDLDDHKDIDHALQRMTARLDPYTTYIDPAMKERFDVQTQGQLSGIGVQIRKDAKTEMLEVVTPILNSPSYKKGLQEGDLIETVIREVDGEGNALNPPEVLHTKDMTLSESVKNIIGKAGTNVKLKVRRPLKDGGEKKFTIEITRDSIEIESVMGVRRLRDDSWDYLLDRDNRIAYIRLSSFSGKTAEDLEEVVTKLRAAGLKGLVLDLRFNPGGLLNAARDISDLFINEGRVVSIRPRGRGEYRLNGRAQGSQLGFPMVCLVNGFSASASEIVSACLQDHGRAIVVGERSYGKGSVQTITRLDGGLLKYTTATFWRPSGVNLNKSSTKGKDDEDWGVRPNKGFLVDLSRKERDDLAEYQRNTEIIRRKDKPAPKAAKFEDRQLEVGLKYLREQIAGATKK